MKVKITRNIIVNGAEPGVGAVVDVAPEVARQIFAVRGGEPATEETQEAPESDAPAKPTPPPNQILEEGSAKKDKK